MGFIANIFSAIIDVIVTIVEAVIQVVEMVVQMIMVLLGWDGGSSQTIEYYEIHNVPLFDEPDKKNPLLQSVIQSVLKDGDIASSLIYHTTFRSLKGNVREFMDFIDDGNYFESFPQIESYILTIDYTELTAALNTLNGVPCTPEGSSIVALSDATWIKYWLQENKEYNVGTNTMGVDYSTTSTSPASIAADTVSVTPSTNHFDISITSGIATADEVFADERWQVDFTNITYNAIPDTYTVQVYNAVTVGSVNRILPYTIPTKPLLIHYVSFYYRDSAPSRQYLFIYRVGAGTYTDLDTVEEPIDIDGASIETLPAVPLRISNSNYTTFGATKKAQIEELLMILHLDAEEVLNAVMDDPDVAPGDVDNIYVNFGVRMWDTSQAGMSYLYNMFANLYPAQGVTQGTYNNAAAGDDKPQNNILTTTTDNKYAFQFAYITFEHTSLVDIDADSGSVENGIYYSDMSKFGTDGLIMYNYYVSSGKGTYNVGYKADDLDEVQDFLDGNGVINPGTTTAEATNWLQVTERMTYNAPTPVLQEADGATSTVIYLTPDMVYENNGSGVLRMVEAASEATTSGQSITYYCCKPSGLDAYTVSSPIAALKVIDGASGRFNMVKFNLGNKPDLMVPFVHNFIKDLSNTEVSKIFLAGAHVSIYIAHYEVIEQAGMSFLMALVMIIIIIVIIMYAPQFIGEAGATLGPIIAAIGAGTYIVAMNLIFTALVNLAINMIIQYAIELIIKEIAGDNEMLAMILNIVAMVAMSGWEGSPSYGPDPNAVATGSVTTNSLGQSMGGGASRGFTNVSRAPTNSFHFSNMTSFNFSSLTAMDYANIAFSVITGVNTVNLHKVEKLNKKLAQDKIDFKAHTDKTAIEDAGYQILEPLLDPTDLTQILRATNRGGALGGHKYFALFEAQYELQYTSWAFSETINNKISNSAIYV
jgi:hypothetical protein